MILRHWLILARTVLIPLIFHAPKLVFNLIPFLSIRTLLKIFSEADLEDANDIGFGIIKLQHLNQC